MYIVRREGYIKVVPICAMEGDRLSGCKAPLIFILGSRQMFSGQTFCTGHFTPREKA